MPLSDPNMKEVSRPSFGHLKDSRNAVQPVIQAEDYFEFRILCRHGFGCFWTDAIRDWVDAKSVWLVFRANFRDRTMEVVIQGHAKVKPDWVDVYDGGDRVVSYGG